MLSFVPRSSAPINAGTMRRRQRLDWWIAYTVVVGLGLLIGAISFHRSGQLYIGLCLALWVALLALWTRLPRTALGVTIAVVLISDIVTVAWFPFLKNFSSRESITYLSDSFTVSPFEITILWALACTAYRNIAATGRPFVSAPLLKPMIGLLLLTASGLVIGLSRGGDSRVAVLEARPLIYLPFVYLLVVNVCRTIADYRRMYWAAIAGIFVQSLLSLNYLLRLPQAARTDIDSLNEHGSAIGMNLVFTMTILALAYRGVSWRVRLTMLAASAPVLWVYLIAQRRAAFIGLGAAMIVFALILFWRQRRTFWKVIPITSIIFFGYVGAFWNSNSSAAFPAQAVKTVIAPDSLSAADQSSDEYRKIENYNLNFTIRADPIAGQGFGRPFLRPQALADISAFELNAYLPHNSLLWVWIKMGFLGFVTVLYLFAVSLMHGSNRVRRVAPGLDLLTVSNAVMFVVMYAMFIFVDVAWEARNVTLLALSMGLCTAYLRQDRDEPATDAVTSGERPLIRPVPAG